MERADRGVAGMMRKANALVSLALVGLVATAFGQALVIDSIDGHGQLVFTAIPTAWVYRVEWSTNLPSETWSSNAPGIVGIPATGAERRTVSVAQASCLYRVVASVTDDGSDLPPPAGMVYIPAGVNSGTNPLAPGESYSSFYPATYSLAVGAFYMDRYEVTKTHWDEVYEWALTNLYSFDNTGWVTAVNHPVKNINWYDCVKWCNARSEKEGLKPAYYMSPARTNVYRSGRTNINDDCVDWNNGYRLPREEYWEYAARGGISNKRFPWGGNIISHSNANYYASQSNDYDRSYPAGYHPDWYGGFSDSTSPVGTFELGKNNYGLYDMAGNMWEWCWETHPGPARMVRSGGWDSEAYTCRIGFRRPGGPTDVCTAMGFRTVLSPGQQ